MYTKPTLYQMRFSVKSHFMLSLRSEHILEKRQLLFFDNYLSFNYLQGIALGNYAVFIEDWLKAFPREQFFVLRMEDWEINCSAILPDIYSFLQFGK